MCRVIPQRVTNNNILLSPLNITFTLHYPVSITVLPYLQFVTTIPRVPLFLVVNAYIMMIYIPKQHSQAAEVETYSSRANNLLTGQEEIGNPYHQPWLLPPPLQLLLPGIQNSRTPVSLTLTAPYKCPRHFKVWRWM